MRMLEQNFQPRTKGVEHPWIELGEVPVRPGKIEQETTCPHNVGQLRGHPATKLWSNDHPQRTRDRQNQVIRISRRIDLERWRQSSHGTANDRLIVAEKT
jgi:hypothetical protein